MDEKIWPEGVKFESAPGHFHIVTSTQEAERVLLSDWPLTSGPKLQEARQACIDVLAGTRPAEVARRAFIEACEEADLYVMA